MGKNRFNNCIKEIAALTLLVLFVNTSFSQTAYKNYIDGEIWFELKTDITNQEASKGDHSNGISPSSFSALEEIFSSHTIIKIHKPTPRAFSSEALMKTYHIKFSDINNVNKFITELEESGTVVYAEKVPLMSIDVVPNDPFHSTLQWGLDSMKAESAWDISTGKSSIIVATTDNAINYNHEDLISSLWTNTAETPGNGIDDDNNGYIDDTFGYDVSDNDNNTNPLDATWDHGTHVAGITGAETNNNVGVSSIGYGISIMAIKVTRDAAGSTTVTNGYDGVYYAALNGADIINCSWGSLSSSNFGLNTINWAASEGSIIVASAGNDNLDNDVTPRYPASYSNTVAVAATSSNDTKANFSCYGANSVDISAPGTSILSTTPFDTYGSKGGTSMAAPMVAGLLGLMKSLNPNLSNADLLDCMYTTAKKIDALNPFYSGELGAGRIDALAAMTCVENTIPPPSVDTLIADIDADILTVYPNPTNNILHIDGLTNVTQINLLDVASKVVYNRINLTSNQLSIDLNTISKGVYYLQVEKPSGTEFVKVVKY